MIKTLPKIYCAIDKPDLQQAMNLCENLTGLPIGIKLGMEFFNAEGRHGVEQINTAYPDTSIFVDLKYHDIPNTVAGAARSITKNFSPAFLNVHAAGGLDMMKAARDACPADTKLLAVTILTSLDEQAIQEVGYANPIADRVCQMASLAKQAGLDGIVCSPFEIEMVRKECGEDLALMVPGIRPAGSAKGDQKRIMTPKDALDNGASHLVIGRPISQAENPRDAAQEILDSLK